MRFLVDAQLPPDLLRWLMAQGHEAWHVRDLGLRNADDAEIWAKATELSAHLITKDEDFVLIRERVQSGPSVIWIRIGNAMNRVLIARLEFAFADMLRTIEDGTPVIEIK